jgi:hypothetical protein
VHQSNNFLPTIIEHSERLIAIRKAKSEALFKLKEIAKEDFDTIEVDFLVSEEKISKMYNQLKNPSFEDYIFVGLKGTNYIKKHLIGSIATQITDNINATTFAIPYQKTTLEIDTFYVGINNPKQFNFEAFNKTIALFPGIEKIIVFTISNTTENPLFSNVLLDKIHHPNESELELTFRVFEDKDMLKESIECTDTNLNKMLVIQKGPRNITDKMFRNFFTNEFVYEGKFAMIILPHNEITILD